MTSTDSNVSPQAGSGVGGGPPGRTRVAASRAKGHAGTQARADGLPRGETSRAGADALSTAGRVPGPDSPAEDGPVLVPVAATGANGQT